ncbi:MAG: hypothetical protein ABL985_10285 [Casimicrobium sp.]
MKDDPSLTTALGLTRYAHDYFDAGRAVQDQMGAGTKYEIVSPFPALFLMAQSIEIAAKAYLLEKGLTLANLRRAPFGHDLCGCLDRANELGLSVLLDPHPADLGAVALLNDLYKSRRLQYIRTGLVNVPDFKLIERFAEALIRSVSGVVGYESFNA